MSPSDDEAANAQWERANQIWALRVATRLADRPPSTLKAVYRALRVKRHERAAFLDRLPGVVRRGARVDLEPLERELKQLGIDCLLVSRSPDSVPPAREGS